VYRTKPVLGGVLLRGKNGVAQQGFGDAFGLLPGEVGVTNASAVVLCDLLVVHVEQQNLPLTLRWDRLSVRLETDRSIEPVVVRHDDLPVLRDHHVHLERRHPEVEGMEKTGNGVLGVKSTRPPMSL